MENNLLSTRILALIEKTKCDKIPWTFTNMQTVIWKKSESNMAQTYTITIQLRRNIRRVIPQGEDHFIFTFQTARPAAQVLLQINTSVDLNMKHDLEQLFYEAQASAKRKTVGILEKLISEL